MRDMPVTNSIRTTATTRRRGFTMAEMMVAVVIMVIVTAVVTGLFVQVRKMIGITQWAAETRTQVRSTIDTLAQDLQNINDQAYLVMLNRDYIWDNATQQAVKLYRSDWQDPANQPGLAKAFWADRVAFVASGSFNALNPGAAGPQVATSARVYYGHSLWTHELPDASLISLNPGWISDPDPALRPQQMSNWTTGMRERSAVDWIFSRQAVIQVQDPAALRSEDTEFRVLSDSPNINAYTYADLTRWLEGAAGLMDWATVVWAPQVYENLPGPLRYNPAFAQRRVLLPHAARLRFQIRLSDGTIVPQTDDAPGVAPMQRGRLVDDSTNPAVTITGTNPSYERDLTAPPAIPVVQKAYVWTPNRTNVTWTPPPDLYPVALRVRVEVYDPQQRTPDPIVVDEWLPMRWNSRPGPAP